MSRNEWVLVGVAAVCVAVALSKASLPYAVWLTVVGILVGGAITALFSWYFYKRAGDELREEAAKLRHSTDLITRGLQDLGVEYIRDEESGEFKALVVKGSALIEARRRVRRNGERER